MNIKELNFKELEEIDNHLKQKLNFINDEIKKLEEFLKQSIFDSYDYLCAKSGGVLLRWDKELKQILYLDNGDKKHISGCSVKIRNITYNNLQNFINRLVDENNNGTR